MSRQTLIPVSLEEESSFDNYLPGDNRELLSDLHQIVHRTSARRVLYFWGEAGSGKTHLLNACCQLAIALDAPHAYLPVSGMEPNQSQLDCIPPQSLLCVDDFQNAAGDEDAWQVTLFEWYEKLLSNGGAVVVAANQPIGALNLGLKDLESRLVSGGVSKLVRMSEADKLAALKFRALQKGFELSAPVLQFIITYYQRDTASLFSLLERIDNASLEAQRKITVPFIKSLL